ncbi:phosphatase 2C-like domain-containing protein [Mycotypha africana]|uniref:phosphatase 2C-like domain-containing protein n=1 Tax=Mycotypha africana TaxID=64632 RepID=UPI0023002DB9|nr:phosphatase 2C-like domain-containing protein [Mycotypha africana]KAI8967799.1 phosphatase 2C-like domain-containing protein [Mycotypha africana]
MRPKLQRIAAASFLLRTSTAPFWRNNVYIKPTLTYHLPSYFHQVVPSTDTTTYRSFSTSHTSFLISNNATASTTAITEDDHDTDSDTTSVNKIPTPHTASDKFQFVAYAAWHPKARQKTTANNNEKAYWKQATSAGKVDAGEDAFFQTTTPEGLAIGVADGVGGWSLVGVDPALFSWTLMDNAATVAKNTKQSINAHDILESAFHELRKSGKVAAGSSTACILSLSKATGEMTSCNLGDSAFLLVRDQKIVYESPSQQHYFNCPYQLTVVPETYPNRDELVTDLPKDADTRKFLLKDGDLILLATDGYFDNMYAEETLEIINNGMQSVYNNHNNEEVVTATIRSLAKTLTDKARLLSLNPKRMSPWAKAAQAHGSNYRGGKVDDITCIVTFVRHKQ